MHALGAALDRRRALRASGSSPAPIEAAKKNGGLELRSRDGENLAFRIEVQRSPTQPPAMGRAPIRATESAEATERASATTSWPARISSRTTGPPIDPVPPSTSTLIPTPDGGDVFPPLTEYLAESGQERRI